MKLNGKKVNLPQLQKELEEKGIIVPGLGTMEDNLHTYDKKGEAIELPLDAFLVVDQHVAKPVVNVPTLEERVTILEKKINDRF
ncbi:uracil phosphoribosyltransferasE [Caudoviricetes sp.]|nr:uracil phosphoribosyltransferasE [Caudoviricetes sp.]UOF80995.1 uracil phosphoribosyltransferasE [Caudoviricetes sp.]UOF81391.1 uracil phosphoribosyltransferasE [Caudoviricetes sp.]